MAGKLYLPAPLNSAPVLTTPLAPAPLLPAPILPAPLLAPPTASSSSQSKRRIIACVQCNKDHKKCDNGAPCSRCVTTGHECTYPVKPPDRLYSKRLKQPAPAASSGPLPSSSINNHPLLLSAALGSPRNHNISQRQQKQQQTGLPSPSHASSTVGTHRVFYADGSYGDSTIATAEALPRFDMSVPLDELLGGIPYNPYYSNAPLFGLEEP
ncbi:hypothetical protein RUND412_005134 [Rhizina undulata]